MSTTTPAGWYPDPKPSDPANPGKRWWNGTDWTVSTKTDEVLTASTAAYPAYPAAPAHPLDPAAVAVEPKKPRKRRPVLVAASVAAVLGLGVGSLATYLIMHNDHASSSASSAARNPAGGFGGNGGGSDGLGGSGGSTGGSGSTGGGTGGSGSGGGSSSGNVAVDVANGITLPDPGTGWTGGTDQNGDAYLSYGSYTCSGSSGGTCSLAGASTSTLTAPVSGGAQAAATADMATAVSQSYGTITGHKQLEAKAVTVAGRSGYLIRWQVDAKVGNNGTVEDVVFPNSANTKLIAVHLGFDIASKAPAVSVMDSIISGIQDYSGGAAGGGTGGGTTS
ncbi:DUF2510 domain-containing protein [Streptacidiphilus sp. PB12-B1b]|uniref:DUF2510 domain-containing protein n=1 Tax=Streptacidiphilus sp. PB12-B1b TaxID=2705012 RepID=UPI0015F8AB5D|nr:DUF2510 domain-containing protein [Streptacidiphilus sp. PB12-B1b]QMU76344.1 DUF2510 domain-containing protein [Streptacidiphilus sp. PB12-B1b]